MVRASFVALALSLLVLGAGCNGDDGAAPDAGGAAATAATSPAGTPSAVPKVDCATVLTQAEAQALAGQKLSGPVQDPVSSLPSCRWESASTGAVVLALAVPASTWARALPEVIGAALDSGEAIDGREELDAALELVEAGGTLDDDAACGVFSAMLHAFQGLPTGATQVVNYVPSKDAPQGINEQACLGGRYYSVQLISSTLKAGPAVEQRIRSALRALRG
ncbi:MAG: hypothetical protein NTV23_15590 [Propionibacteriales bacterium]|nr:hypothetical protein [Propionibacteriales bacterium]